MPDKTDNPHGGPGKGAPGKKRHWAGPGRTRTPAKPATTAYEIRRLLEEARRPLEQPVPVRPPGATVARQMVATIEWLAARVEELEAERAEWGKDKEAYARLITDWNRTCDALDAAGAEIFMPFRSERWQWHYRDASGEADTPGEANAAVIAEMVKDA